MEVNIIIKNSEVYEDIFRVSEYTGAKAEDPNTYLAVSNIDEDSDLLDQFLSEARGIANDLFKRHISKDESDAETYNITLDMPSNYDEVLTNSITSSLKSYMVNYVQSKWFLITKKDEAEKYAIAANSLLNDVRTKYNYRVRPVRNEKHIN